MTRMFCVLLALLLLSAPAMATRLNRAGGSAEGFLVPGKEAFQAALRDPSILDGQLGAEMHGSGPLKGFSVIRGYDALGRLQSVKLPGGFTVSYSYDQTTGALSGVTTAGGTTGTWGNFDAVTGKAQSASVGPLSVSQSFDGLGRVVARTNSSSGAPSSAYSYAWDADGHCSSVTGPEGTWSFSYSTYGYLSSATGWKNYGYDFDEAGRPTNATDYRPTARINGSTVDIFGSVAPAATLAINSNSVAVNTNTGLFSASFSPAPGTWQSFDLLGTVAGAGNNGTDAVAEETFHVFVPPAVEALTYDPSGNLSGDARWAQEWDELDRLTTIAETNAPPSPIPSTRVDCLYDLEGRRVEKKVTVGGAVAKRTTTLWDGWRPVVEVDYSGDNFEMARRYYTWGPDVSGTIDGAAGIGGLLEIYEIKGNTKTRSLPVYDGNGNVVGLVDGDTGQSVATYSYGPFGEVAAAYGERASASPFRFQTKIYDPETGYYYFGKRYYDPETRTWLSRDPLREGGGINLYAYCGNDPVGRHDPVGLCGMDGADGSCAHVNVFAQGKSLLVSGDEAMESQFSYAASSLKPEDMISAGTRMQLRRLHLESLRVHIIANNNIVPELGAEQSPYNGHSESEAIAAAWAGFLWMAEMGVPIIATEGFMAWVAPELYAAEGALSLGARTVPALSGIEGAAGSIAVRGFASEEILAVGRTGMQAAKTTETLPASAFERTHGLSGNASTRNVQGIMDDMRVNGWQGKPIDVFENNGSKYILDGHHRVEAARRVRIEVPYNSVPESDLGTYFYSSADDVIRAATEAGPVKLRVR